MTSKDGGRGAMESYYGLIKGFPLIPIRDDDYLNPAIEFLDGLLCRDLDEGEEAYLEVLGDLIEAYEDEHVTIPDASEGDVLRLLMESRGITQTRLARESGVPQSTISKVLRGAGRLTRDQIETFAKYFHVGRGAFLPEPSGGRST